MKDALDALMGVIQTVQTVVQTATVVQTSTGVSVDGITIDFAAGGKLEVMPGVFDLAGAAAAVLAAAAAAHRAGPSLTVTSRWPP